MSVPQILFSFTQSYVELCPIIPFSDDQIPVVALLILIIAGAATCDRHHPSDISENRQVQGPAHAVSLSV